MRYCSNCGKEIGENDKFCGACGAAQQVKAPEAKRIKTKKKTLVWIPVTALILVVGIIAAVALSAYFSRTELVYVITDMTKTFSDGEEVTVSLSYDEFGNHLIWESRSTPTYYNRVFDDYGNIIEEYHALCYDPNEPGYVHAIDAKKDHTGHELEESLFFRCEYTYDGDQIATCTVSNGAKQATWAFEWDKSGNLCRVERVSPLDYNTNYAPLWHQCEYDKENRLETEYICWPLFEGRYEEAVQTGCRILRMETDYDRDGNVIAYEIAECYTDETDCTNKDPESFDYTIKKKWRFTYDDKGKILTQKEYNGDNSLADQYEYTYDNRGNLKSFGGDEVQVEFDRYGNPIGNNDGVQCTYKPVRMTHEAADRYYRWLNMSNLYDVQNRYFLEYRFLNFDTIFYYYLIPNYVW